MWLYMVAAALIVLAAVGAVVGGGILTIICVPLAVIAIIAASVSGGLGRLLQGSGRGQALPDAGGTPSPTTPDELVNARQGQQ